MNVKKKYRGNKGTLVVVDDEGRLNADTPGGSQIRGMGDNDGFIDPTKGLFTGVTKAGNHWQMGARGPR